MMEYRETHIPFGSIRVLMASSAGSAHGSIEALSQDAVGFCHDDHRFVLAVSDGVGSCRHAAHGAKLAIEAAMRLLDVSDTSDENLVNSIIRCWIELLEYPASECAATLHFVLGSCSGFIFGRIGDGLRIARTLTRCMIDQDENGFMNLTSALPMKEAFHLERLPLQALTVLLMSDGISNELDLSLAYEQAEYMKYIVNFSSYMAVEEVRAWIELLHGKNGDDKTIGALVFEVGKEDTCV